MRLGLTRYERHYMYYTERGVEHRDSCLAACPATGTAAAWLLAACPLACNAQIYHLWGGRPTVLRLLRGLP